VSARTDERVRSLHGRAVAATAGLALGIVGMAAVAFALVGAEGYRPALPEDTARRVGALAIAAVLLGFARPLERRVDRPPRGADHETEGRAWLSGVIAGMAVRGAAGLMGGVLILLTGDVRAGGALALATVAVMSLAAPRRRDLERRIRKAG
jgi:hypothetical protein